MDETIKEQLELLGLRRLSRDWNDVLSEAKKKQPSYHRFLTDIIQKEYSDKKEKTRLSRIKRANIPELLVMETFPFSKQPRLKKRLVMELYDSMRFITQKQELIFIGPTGCGKTGLASSFLIHAINHGYRGYFMDFRRLMKKFSQSRGDHTEHKLLKKLLSYDILLIDELGYEPVEKELAGLLFELLKGRNKRHTTILTTQLGFEEWGSFLENNHLTAALLDRITVNCTVFNMKECISIRPKNIVYAAKD
ncbi:MAG: ATP-binding protein [bacterium]